MPTEKNIAMKSALDNGFVVRDFPKKGKLLSTDLMVEFTGKPQQRVGDYHYLYVERHGNQRFTLSEIKLILSYYECSLAHDDASGLSLLNGDSHSAVRVKIKFAF